MTQNKFLPHVQGLRALAVLSVFLHHMNEAWLPGGFVGVDVFFVISGFLITSHIVDQGKGFTLSGFYFRRVRRIIPNQLLVIALVIAAALVLTPRGMAQQTVASGAWAAAMLSNVFFYRQAGYFAPDADTMPLLHMWSLAVEEQFYMIWPLAVMGLLLTKRRGAIVAAVFLALLVATELVISRDPDAAFYLTPFRITEFMCGGLLVFFSQGRFRLPAPIALAVVLGSMVVLTPETRFPGAMALIPCLATAALILWGGEGFVGRILSSRLAQAIGDRSYALYLVHWPVLVFLYIKFPMWQERVLLAVPVAFLITEAIYRFWEKPLRYMKLERPKTRFAYAAAVVLAAAVLTLGGGAFAGRKAMASTGEPTTPQLIGCDTLATCDAETLVIGDSHTGHVQMITGGARSYFPGCPPLFGSYKVYRSAQDSWKTEVCRTLIADWERDVTRSPVKTVVLAARWAWLSEPGPYGGEDVRQDAMVTAQGQPLTTEHSRRVIASQLAHTVEVLRKAGKHVVVFGQVPLHTKQEIACVTAKGRDEGCHTVSKEETLRRTAYMDGLLRELKVEVVIPSELLCEGECLIAHEGKVLYKDTNHLSAAGAAYLKNKIKAPSPTP